MNSRLLRTILFAFLATVCVALIFSFMRLSPSLVLVYAHSDTFGPIRSSVAQARAWFWTSCPADAFAPNTPLGAVAASLEGSSSRQESSILSVADAMLASGCNVNEFGQTGTTPLLDAVLYGDPVAVRALLQRGADPDLRKKPAHNREPSAVDGMNAVELARYLLPRPVGPKGDRQAVHGYLSQHDSTGMTRTTD